ncbi:MAG: zf-TFIIB domain-containing protein [Gemmatimonadetes bacterium]|nr:zf-TFIIB domain-containing protein [Gemmatimonadota bacterium]
MTCPNCDAPVEHRELEGVYGPAIEIDACFACHVLWFDRRESIHLTPRGTLDLFQALHEHRDDPRHAIGNDMTCPRCGTRLTLRKDIGKGGRFSYYACPSGHGRLTPFSEFLKEKQFVRQLNPLERERLKAEVKTVQCSGCGAPVNVSEGFSCGHCGSPLSVLDADAVEKTLNELVTADAERGGDPKAKEMYARAIASMEATRTRPDDYFEKFTTPRRRSEGLFDAGDLLSFSIGLFFGR